MRYTCHLISNHNTVLESISMVVSIIRKRMTGSVCK